MGILGDMLGFFGSIFLGEKQRTEAFTEELNSAERYLRWGIERQDLRDFNAAIEHLQQCRDEDAARPEHLSMKYIALCNASTGATDLLIDRYKSKTTSLSDESSGLEEEKGQLERDIKAMEEHIRTLEADGSLIKAKEQGRELAQKQSRLNAVKRSLESGENLVEMASVYAEMAVEAERILRTTEDALLRLEMNPEVSPETVQQVRDAMGDRLQKAREEIAALRPSGKS